MQDAVVRPRADRAWASRIPLALIALAFAATQLYLARLDSGKAVLVAVIIGGGILTLVVGYVMFLSKARVAVSGSHVTVSDWLGRRQFHAERGTVNLRLVSVKDMGISDDFALLWAKQTSGEVSVTLLRRVAWGNQALSALRVALHGQDGELHFRPVSKRELAVEFPQVHVQNLLAIAVIVLAILLLAIVVSR
jgi:hypothetical protein